MPRRLAAILVVLLSSLFAAGAMGASLLDSGSRPASRVRSTASRADRGGSIYGHTYLRAHVGFSAPTGDFGDVYDSGPGFGGAIAHGVSRSVLLSFGIAYHHFDNQRTSALNASVTPFTMNAEYVLPSSSRVRPWIGGGMGMYHVTESLETDVGGLLVRDSISENNFGINLGMGVGAPVSERTLVGAGVRFHQVWGNDFIDTPFVTFQVGMGFAL